MISNEKVLRRVSLMVAVGLALLGVWASHHEFQRENRVGIILSLVAEILMIFAVTVVLFEVGKKIVSLVKEMWG